MKIICERLQAFGLAGGEVRPLGQSRIRIVLPRTDTGGSQLTSDQIAATGQLYFYDWEPNLIGPERKIGGHPGASPPAGALSRAKREWRAAGRDVKRQANLQLILAGAFPTAYAAVKLASEQSPRRGCAVCATSRRRFYLFNRSTHELIAGPGANRADLRRVSPGRRSRHGIVLEVPAGAAVLTEQPTSRTGTSIIDAEPGWYAFRDRPALTGSDIVRPKEELDEFAQPAVTFGFTKRGRIAFQRVTRAIARRGRAAAVGKVGDREAEELSGHFAVAFDGEVVTRPIINFAEFPNGIDGYVGAQISGGFTGVREARDLAAILKTGALPVNMTLVRRKECRLCSPRAHVDR